jgi:hypothetical protein
MLAPIVILAAGLAAVGGIAFAQPVTNGCLPDSAVDCIDQPPRANDTMIARVFGTNNATGTISSLLMPVEGSGAMDMMTDQTRQKAMRFSMAQDVAWILAGNWSLSDVGAGSKAIDFDAESTKVTTEGTMRHTHRIANFTLSPDTVSYFVFTTDPPILSISGRADLYFDGELAWKQAGISLQEHAGVLKIEFDSADIDNHFHGMPIYGMAK